MRRGALRARKANPAVDVIRPADRGIHAGATRPYDPIEDAVSQHIIDAALDLLASSGVAFEAGGEATRLFAQAGCAISNDGVVRIPRMLVERSLETVAKGVELWDRAGTQSLRIDSRHSWFFPGMTCIKAIDLETGSLRESNRADLDTMVRVADALPDIDGVCIGCKNIARSDIFGEIDEFAAMAENTTKPLLYLCENAESLEVIIEMAAAIRGGRAALAEQPYFMHIVTPLPLNFARTHSDQIVAAVRAGVPVSAGTLPIGGASTPITIAGAMMHTLATDLAAIVLGQLVRPGSFCIGSSDVCFMEPASGSIGSFAQTSLADMAMNQIRRKLGIPSLTSPAGATVARRFNQDLVWEVACGMMQMFYNRPVTAIYLGAIDQGLTYSLHALLLCNDMAGLLRKLWQGIAVDADHLALDLARDVGPLGHFLGQTHTAAHCRAETWNSRYFGAHIPVSTGGAPDRDLYARIDADLREILATHRPPPLEAVIATQLNDIQERFAASRQRALACAVG